MSPTRVCQMVRGNGMNRCVVFVFGLAPLEVRRQIAMLGVIHRCVLGLGPPHFSSFFKRVVEPQVGRDTRSSRRLHSCQLEDIRNGKFLEVQRRSALGLVWVYNHLPGNLVEATRLSSFQRGLQEFVKARVLDGCDDWRETLSSRVEVARHPLR